MKRILIELDGTICDERPTFEKCLSKPIKKSKKTINKLYQDNFIIIYTARSWNEYKMTKQWLKKHKIKHHLLMCGKPVYDIWIDDRAIMFDEWKNISKKINTK